MFKVGFYLGSAFLKPCTTSLKLTRDSLFCGCITHKNQLGHLEAHSKSHGSLLFEITRQLFQRALTPPARPHLQRRLFGQTLPQQHSRQQPAKPAHQASEHCCLATAWGWEESCLCCLCRAGLAPASGCCLALLMHPAAGKRVLISLCQWEIWSRMCRCCWGEVSPCLHPLTEGKMPQGRDALS